MRDKPHKMITPVAVVSLIALYYIVVGIMFAYMNGVPTLAKVLALVLPGVLTGVAVTLLVQRIARALKKDEKNIDEKDRSDRHDSND